MELYNKIKSDLLWFLTFVFVISIVSNFFNYKWDSTDGEERSGMTLHVDNMTGCQYLGRFFGSVTPRLDSNGNHICFNSLQHKQPD